MKKQIFLLFIAMLNIGLTVQATNCGSESFDNANIGTSYSNGFFVGDNGVTWTYVQSRNQGSNAINGNGIMLRKNSSNSTVVSSAVAGGITDFTCSLKKAFSGSGNRQVELFVNGVSKGVSILWDNTTVQTFSVTGINISGFVTIEIRNIATSNRQVVVDDISWTCYTPPAGTPLITASTASVSGLSYQEGSGPSASQTETISATDLTGNMSATNVTNFEFSYDNSTWFANIGQITPAVGTIPSTTIYVRLIAGLVSGTYTDNLTLSSTGAQDVNIVLNGTVTPGPCSSLFFSEYIEGTSSNKCIEIYNPTSSSITLNGNYQIKRYSNGSTSASTYSLTGIILSGDVYVLCHTSASALFTVNSDATNFIASWTGDDAIELLHNGTTIDIIGQIGFDPGNAWSNGGISTANQTLTRKTTIQIGDADGSNVFDPSIEWDSHLQNDASFLGSHTTACVAVCDISAIAVGTQTVCVPATNNYTQEVVVTYSAEPGTGTLDVNGQSFGITTSPQTVTLVGLIADGAAVNVTAAFSANTGCMMTTNSLFTAPVNCSVTCNITGITAGTQTVCVPATNTYTQDVTVAYGSAPGTGTLDVNGQSFAITTSPQTVTLTGLTSDGNAVNVIAVFSADAGCTFTSNNLFTATADCSPPPPCVELFFSEYIEGSNSNKCIEIYNPTNAAVNLGTGNYKIKKYNNGSTNGGLGYSLTGTIPSGGVYVVCSQFAFAAFLANADVTNFIAGWNGDDAVELSKNGVTIDVIGRIGYDPGTSWSNGGVSTANQTLTRKSSIQAGDMDGSNAFDPSIEWDSHPQNDASFLGSHTTACVTLTYVWTGLTDNDWNTASNWSSSIVPSITDVATIPTGVTNYPTITPSIILGDVTVANGATLIVVAGIVLDGTLTNNGTVILQDGAYLDDFTNIGASFVGDITVETIAANGLGNDQRFISSPVNNPNISEIADDLNGPWGIGVQGVNGVAVTVDDCNTPTLTSSSNYGNLFEFDETLVTNAASCPLDGWVVRSSGSLENARGYSAYLTTGNTFDFSGTPNTGNITIATTNTGSGVVMAEGWNLLGNPYPSPISRNDLITAGATDVSYFVTTGVYQGSFTSYGIGSNIAITQGFQAHVNTNGNILFTNSMRNTNAATWHENDNWFEYKLDISVFGSTYADKTTLFYNNDATNSYEAMYDVRKRMSDTGHPSISTFNTLKDLTLNGMSVDNLGETVPLNLSSGANGSFTLSFEGMETFPENTTIYVKDLLTNTVHNIANGDYVFTANENDNVERFELIFIPEISLITTNTDCEGNLGSISLENTNYTVFRTYDLFLNNNMVSSNDLTALNEQLASGNYILNVNDQFGGVQTYNIEIVEMEIIVAAFDVLMDNIEVGDLVSFNNLTTNATSLNWIIENNTLTNVNNVSYSFENAGLFDVVLNVENTDCSDVIVKTISVANKTTGLENLLSNKISIYPNPVKEILIIDYTEKAIIEIVNVLGETILSSTEKSINVKGINSGIYFVNVYNSEKELISINKIIKE